MECELLTCSFIFLQKKLKKIINYTCIDNYIDKNYFYYLLNLYTEYESYTLQKII
jgi:hypothetical protein